MTDHNDNDDDDFLNDVFNVEYQDDNEQDQDDANVPYGIDDDDYNVDVQDDDACHNTSGYCRT